MVNLKKENPESILRKNVSKFLRSPTSHRAPLSPFLRKISKLGGAAFFFGGTLRDLMLFGLGKHPRDIDVVVLSLSNRLRSFLEPYIQKSTRFDGIEVELGHWDIDLWELSSTWAFRSGFFETEGFETLPKTTFLDVQAVAAKICSEPGSKGRIFEHGFFNAIHQKTIGINFEENPYPARCVLSALTTARKLNFSLSPGLVRYVLHHAARIDLKELCAHQQRQLGRVLFPVDTLHCWIKHLESSYRRYHSSCVKLPIKKTPGQNLLPWHGYFEFGTVSLQCQATPAPAETNRQPLQQGLFA